MINKSIAYVLSIADLMNIYEWVLCVRVQLYIYNIHKKNLTQFYNSNIL